MRAALTILGVAIGVTVVMVIGALISGFNKGISDMLASLGPKTFWVGRYWGGQGDEDPEDPNPWRRRPERDRKSTRLNSSHDQISYAVFCLKKKKRAATPGAGLFALVMAWPAVSSGP